MRFVKSEELELGTVIGRDIIITAQKTAMLKKGTVLNERYIDYLRNKGYLGAYVSDPISKDIDIEETLDQEIFREGVDAVMEEDIGDILGVSTDIVENILSKEKICTDLIDLRSYDDYTYHHSVNVAVYAVLVGYKLGFTSEELISICQAGLLHDIGKSKIPDEVLNKPDKLTDEEFEVMKHHAQLSYEMIEDSYEISAAVKQAVLCHHENENGSGYPLGKEGKDLNLMAKIIHVVDVYDALTSKRPYKDPFEPLKAFEYIRSGIDRQYNKQVVMALIEVIPPYPVGMDVYLSDGTRAIVIDHSKNRIRPIVRKIDTGETINLAADNNYQDIKIKGLVSFLYDNKDEKISELNESRSAVKKEKKRIFIVDSNKAYRIQLEGIFENDAKLFVFKSGLEALTEAKESGAPDLIITETDLPILDGLTAVSKLRDTTGIIVPAIFLSQDKSAGTILKAKQMGKTDYILKPANPAYVMERALYALYNGM